MGSGTFILSTFVCKTRSNSKQAYFSVETQFILNKANIITITKKELEMAKNRANIVAKKELEMANRANIVAKKELEMANRDNIVAKKELEIDELKKRLLDLAEELQDQDDMIDQSNN
jgi:uncharacterized protein (DUF3084 family)